MKRKNDRLVALLGAVLCVCACLVGCERKEAASSEPPASNSPSASPAPVVSNAPAAKQVLSRAEDAKYQAQVKGRIDAQRRIRDDRAKLLGQREKLRARARRGLPPDATEERVTAELMNDPKLSKMWLAVEAALKQNEEQFERNNAEAQAMVRRRIQREVAEQTSAKQ